MPSSSRPHRAIARRENGWWVIRVPELRDLSIQVRRLDSAEAAARAGIARHLDVIPESISVTVGVELDRDAAALVGRAVETREVAEAAARAASAASRAAVRRLGDQGLSIRDIGAVMGISHQRVAQLGAAGERHRSPADPAAA